MLRNYVRPAPVCNPNARKREEMSVVQDALYLVVTSVCDGNVRV